MGERNSGERQRAPQVPKAISQPGGLPVPLTSCCFSSLGYVSTNTPSPRKLSLLPKTGPARGGREREIVSHLPPYVVLDRALKSHPEGKPSHEPHQEPQPSSST